MSNLMRLLKRCIGALSRKDLVNQHDIKVEENEILDYFRSNDKEVIHLTLMKQHLKNTVFSLMKNREQVNRAIEVCQ